MTVIKCASLLLVLLVTAITAQDCRVTLQQQLRSSWSSDAGQFSLYDVRIVNSGSVGVRSLTVSPGTKLDGVWELNDLGNNVYSLPDWRAQVGIAVGEYHDCGYIVSAGVQAEFTVLSCEDGPVTPTTPTDAPVAPTDAPVAPTDAPVAPTDVPVAPTDAPVAPTDAPVAPTDAPAAPTDAPKPTDAPVAPTDKPTRAPTGAPTVVPTKQPTNAPTGKPTAGPSSAPTAKPATAAPTDAPTKPATSAPTAKPATSAPTAKPATSAPTTAPTTKAATSPPSNGGNGKLCAGSSWWQPAPLTTYQWQLTGTIDTSVNVQMYDIDLFDNTAATISTLHKAGRIVICYFSTQYENWRPDAASFTSAVQGNALDGWAGEKYVDIRSTVVRNIMAARMDLAVSKGCDGIEPDNVDGYTANTGFPLTAANQLDFNKFIAAQAHARGLSVGLKNDLDQATALQPYFDWALNEQCYQYGECSSLNSFINAGKAVFNTEYSGSASTVCNYMNGIKFSSLIKTLSLTAAITAECCTYRSGGCAPVSAAPTCGSTVSALLKEEAKAMENPIPDFVQPQVRDSSSVAVGYSAALFLAAALCGLLIA